MRESSNIWAPPIYRRLLSSDKRERDMSERCLLKIRFTILPPPLVLSKVLIYLFSCLKCLNFFCQKQIFINQIDYTTEAKASVLQWSNKNSLLGDNVRMVIRGHLLIYYLIIKKNFHFQFPSCDVLVILKAINHIISFIFIVESEECLHLCVYIISLDCFVLTQLIICSLLLSRYKYL